MVSRIVPPRFLGTAAALGRRPSVRAAASALALIGFAAGSLPLLDAPGYELGMVGALAAVLLGGPLGIAAARLERRGEAPSPASAAGAAALVLAVLLGALFAGSTLRASLGPCRVLSQAALFPVLALPSAALSAAAGVAAGFAARGRRFPAALLHAGAVAASLAATLAAAWRGPAAFALDHFLGVWPGPLYDEAVGVDARTALFRLETLALAAALAAAAEVAARRARRPAGRPWLGPVLVLLAAAAAAGGASAAREAAGLSGDRETLARALAGRRSGAACTVLFPAEKPAAAADALLSECEFHAFDLARALGLPRPPPITLYVHRSTAEKRRLVGAAGTDYAKPWLGEIQVLDGPLPLPSLRHELVHAVAAPVAGGLLGVPARAGLIVEAGLVEGLAVALEGPRGAWTAHEWARAMRDLGLLPEVEALIGPAGFLGAAPARGYVAAGSFLAFLLERRGPAAVTALYRTGDFEASLGVPAADLAAEWSRFLDGVEVPAPLAASARERFARRSLFERRCAREEAGLEREAATLASAGHAREAGRAWRRAAALARSPGPLRAAGDALAARGDLDAAEEAYREAEAAAGPDDRAFRLGLVAARGDLAWRRGDRTEAAARWANALAGHPDRAEERLLRAKLAAVAEPEIEGAVRAWVLGTSEPAVALASLARSRRPLAAYLVGRALLARGEAAAALPDLERAAAGPLEEPLGLEARFLLARARCATGDRVGGEAALDATLREAGRAADRERARMELRRCAFDAGR
jgi:tetratricopeptide (TPR) repeat protein